MAFAGATSPNVASAMVAIPTATFLRDSTHFLQFGLFRPLQNHLGFRLLLSTARTYCAGQQLTGSPLAGQRGFKNAANTKKSTPIST